jgi:hypothetical protein
MRIRLATSLAVLVIAIYGCGGAPSGSGGPTDAPDPNGPVAALLPSTLGGEPLVVVSATGTDLATAFPGADGATLASELDKLHVELGQLQVASGVNTQITVGVVRVGSLHWTPESTTLAKLVTLLVQPVGRLHVTAPTLAAKRVMKISDRDDPDYAVYAFTSRQTSGDNVFFARGPEPLLEEFFGAIR